VSPQLTIDGREVEVPRIYPLSNRQRELLRFIRSHGVVRPIQVGMLMHRGRANPCLLCLLHGTPCQYASSDGYDALARLARRGLVMRIQRGRWTAVVSGEGWG
jgi:hypothetical protein